MSLKGRALFDDVSERKGFNNVFERKALSDNVSLKGRGLSDKGVRVVPIRLLKLFIITIKIIIIIISTVIP